jgi:hypothetical protein
MRLINLIAVQMIKKKYPIVLSLAIFSSLFILLSYKRTEVPVSRASKLHYETAAFQKSNLTTESFGVVNDRRYESGSKGWDPYAILKFARPTTPGEGC